MPKVTFMPFKSHSPKQRDSLHHQNLLSSCQHMGCREHRKGRKVSPWVKFRCHGKLSEGNLNKVLGQEGTTSGMLTMKFKQDRCSCGWSTVVTLYLAQWLIQYSHRKQKKGQIFRSSMDVRARRAWGIWVLSASFYMEGTKMKDFLAQKLRSPCLLPLCCFFSA